MMKAGDDGGAPATAAVVDEEAPGRVATPPPPAAAADDVEAIHEEKKVESPSASPVTTPKDAEAAAVEAEKLKLERGNHAGKEASDTEKDGDTEEMELSAEDQANCLSSWLLLYLSPLLRLGATKVLQSEDVGPPSKCDRAGECYDKVRELWVVEVEKTRALNEANKLKHQAKLDAIPESNAKKRKKVGTFKPKTPNLAMVLWRSFGVCRVWTAVALYVLSALLQFMPVLILNDLVGYFESSDPENYTALLFHPWGDVAGLFVFPFLVSLFQTRSQVILNHCAIFIRTSVSTLLFSKALTISAAGRAQTSTGQVVNMVRV